MRISADWLAEFVELPQFSMLCELLTTNGIEVEQSTDPRALIENVIVAEVVHCERHPNADKLKLCQASAVCPLLPRLHARRPYARADQGGWA